MKKIEQQRLIDIVDPLAPAGSNDARWFMVEHQLTQAKMSLQLALEVVLEIAETPENRREGIVASGASSYIKSAYISLLQEYTAFLHYISDSDVPERVARQER